MTSRLIQEVLTCSPFEKHPTKFACSGRFTKQKLSRSFFELFCISTQPSSLCSSLFLPVISAEFVFIIGVFIGLVYLFIIFQTVLWLEVWYDFWADTEKYETNDVSSRIYLEQIVLAMSSKIEEFQNHWRKQALYDHRIKIIEHSCINSLLN